MSVVRPTSDTKDRLKMLVIAYFQRIRNKIIDVDKIKARIPDKAIEDHDPLELAKTLAQDAFRQGGSPIYYFSATENCPTHCLHLNILEVDELQVLVENTDVTAVNGYLESHVTSFENLVFAFTSRHPVDITSLENVDAMCKLFVQLGRMNDCKWSTLVPTAVSKRVDLPSNITIFGTVVSSTQLLERCAAMLVIASPAFSFEDNLKLMPFLAPLLEKQQNNITKMIKAISAESLRKLVTHFEDFLSLQILAGDQANEQLIFAGQILSVLNQANYEKDPRGLLPFATFYNGTAVGFGIEDMKVDFDRFLKNRRPGASKLFCFSSFPFLVDTNFKSIVMQLEAAVEQQGAMRSAMVGMLFGGGQREAEQHFLLLNIDRAKLIESTLRELNRKSGELKKPLKVKFAGEEGIDEGGLRKEFFQLICKELLDPNFGMFQECDGGRFLWFQPHIKCNSNRLEFFLIGQTLGLAVYNNIILSVNFPKVLFRRLLGLKPDFEDLRELDPSFAEGLQALLDFSETEDLTVEDTFCRTFVFEHEVFGSRQEVEIVPGGKDKVLTGKNRKEFVDAMVNYVVDESVRQNFEEFRKGFLAVCDRSLVSSMRPEELELLASGNPNIDFQELERTTRYDGYKKDDVTIKMFWEVVHSFSEDQQKKFLKFVTGSDRVPIRGLKDLGFIIGKNGDETSKQLPTAHTCFNVLMMPPYKDKDDLRQKLLLAIENCTGFGLK